MLHSNLISSILTLSFTYSWYSLYGVQHFGKSKFFGQGQEDKKAKPSGHVVPIYMWDIYNNGVNSSEIDVVRGIYPVFSGISFSSFKYQHHRRKELKFIIPKPKQDEVLVKGEVKIITKTPKDQTIYFQIYLKSGKWVFLDEKKVSNVNVTWISLQVSSKNILKPGSVTFVIITFFQNRRKNYCRTDFVHPVLLLSYFSKSGTVRNSLDRKKRSLGLEGYEEKTNRIWEDEILSQKISKYPAGVRNTCRRKSLYIKFSEIDYDSWIVAPSGYEAFQCVGKCTFPLSEHLSPTKHAILQTLLHNISPWKASRACCVPTRLDPISVLYIDENGVLTYRFRYRDMVVAECGCR